MDNAPGDLVVLETSVRNKPLVDVLAHVRQLLPSPFRTLHVWFAFSSVVLVHKAPPPKQEQGATGAAAVIISTTGEMEDTLLSKCVAEGNFLGSVLAGSGRLGLFTQSADQQAAPPSPLLTVHAQQVDAERQTLKEVREIFEESSRQQETRHQQALRDQQRIYEDKLLLQQQSYEDKLQSQQQFLDLLLAQQKLSLSESESLKKTISLLEKQLLGDRLQ